jgi:hypothetical protein
MMRWLFKSVIIGSWANVRKERRKGCHIFVAMEDRMGKRWRIAWEIQLVFCSQCDGTITDIMLFRPGILAQVMAPGLTGLYLP